jgi:hypothetical protein
MIIKNYLLALALLLSIGTMAQSEIPAGFIQGKVILNNGNEFSGWIKDNMRKKSSIIFYNPSNGKKLTYDATNLSEADLNNGKYLCLYGDFFKVITAGEHAILQKSSNAPAKPYYNGVETIISHGTEGKIDDQFEYSASTNDLKLIPKKG